MPAPDYIAPEYSSRVLLIAHAVRGAVGGCLGALAHHLITGVSHLQENAPPLGMYRRPMPKVLVSWARYPCTLPFSASDYILPDHSSCVLLTAYAVCGAVGGCLGAFALHLITPPLPVPDYTSYLITAPACS